MGLLQFEERLIELKVKIQQKQIEEARQQRLAEEERLESKRLMVANFSRHIEQEIEKWHDVVCTHLEVLAKQYWGSEYFLKSSEKPNSDDIYKMATTAVETGAVCHTWAAQKGVLGPLQSKIGKFEVTLYIVKDIETAEHIKSYLVVGFRYMDTPEHQVTTYEELVALLLQAFANGPLLEYNIDVQ